MAYAQDVDAFCEDNLFHQNGRSVFKEVCPMAADHLTAQVEAVGLSLPDVRRWWLHQANINMNLLIVRRLLLHDRPGHRHGDSPAGAPNEQCHYPDRVTWREARRPEHYGAYALGQ